MGAPEITDHALVRFLERVAGMDVEAVRAALSVSLSRAHTAARAMSSHDYLITLDGNTYVVRGERVTTVMDGGSSTSKFHSIEKRGMDKA